jgi:threonine aldolase
LLGAAVELALDERLWNCKEEAVTLINLYSDTQTRPSVGMRRAIAAAEVADEQRLLDPTTNALQQRVAELLGHEAGLLLPTGSMCNQIAVLLHITPGGDELLIDRSAHPVNSEAGGPARLAGAMIRTLDGEGGMFTPAQLEAAIRPGTRYQPRSRLVSVEQTTNHGGGHVWPLEQIQDVLEVAREHGLRAHMDGARLLNAVVASGVSASDYAGGFDSAWLDFTKGLGAPVGAVLVGSRDLIAEAWRYKQMLGGAFRQSGIISAGCLYALDHNVERLADDHALARTLAEGLAEIPGIALDPGEVETNIVMFTVEDARRLVKDLADKVELQALDPRRVRAVTHMDVDANEIEQAIAAIGEAVTGGPVSPGRRPRASGVEGRPSRASESPPPPTEWRRDGYLITTDPARFDIEAIWEFLTNADWSPGISRDLVERGIANSLSFSLMTADGEQAGFSRLVTDRATFAWLCDVFVLESHRGRGLGKWLVETAVSHPDVAGLHLLLATYDAHRLYAQFGFEPASMMQRPRTRPLGPAKA